MRLNVADVYQQHFPEDVFEICFNRGLLDGRSHTYRDGGAVGTLSISFDENARAVTVSFVECREGREQEKFAIYESHVLTAEGTLNNEEDETDFLPPQAIETTLKNVCASFLEAQPMEVDQSPRCFSALR